MEDGSMRVEAPKANPEPLAALVKDARAARLVVPEFQRSFVWDKAAIEELLASILHGYFIGTLLILDTSSSAPLFPFRPVEGLELVDPKAGADDHSTVRLLLDGQQRISSLFYALYAPDIGLKNAKYPSRFWLDIELALRGEIDDAVRGISHWFVQGRREMEERSAQSLAVPFTLLSDPGDFHDWLYEKQDAWTGDARSEVRELYQRFEDFVVPVVALSPDTGKDNIVNIFERINRTGQPLSLFDLAGARLYTKDVRLRDRWDELTDHHRDVAEAVKPDAMLRVIAVLEGKEPRKPNLLDVIDDLDQDAFEARWQQATQAVVMAYKRMSEEYGAFHDDLRPYTTMVVPLAAMLVRLQSERAPEELYRRLDAWYWGSIFTQRYDNAVDTKTHADIRALTAWSESGDPPPWLVSVADPDSPLDLMVEERRSAIYRGVMSLIAREGARDFLTGQPARLLECDDDHIFCQDVYRDHHRVSVVMNRTLLSSGTNRVVKGAKKPSDFAEECLSGHGGKEERLLETLETHFISHRAYDSLRQDAFDDFVSERHDTIVRKIRHLLAPAAPPTEVE